MRHCTALKEAGSGPRRTAKTGPSAFYSLHQYLLLPPAAPPVFCGLGAANRSNRKQLESTAAARAPGLTVLVQQVLRGEADTRLTAVSAHTDGRLTQDGTHTHKKNCLHLLTPKVQIHVGFKQSHIQMSWIDANTGSGV